MTITRKGLNMREITRREFMRLSTATLFSLATPPLLSGCSAGESDIWLDRKSANLSILSKAGLRADEQLVFIEGLQREYHFVVVNDLHIIVPNEEVRQDAMDDVMARYEMGFVDDNGVTADQMWDRMVDTIKEMDVDGVILAADMLDFYSQANVDCLRQGCERLQVPFLYIRADHDYTDGYCQPTDWETVAAAHDTIDAHEDVAVMDCGEFLVMGINNTTSQLTEEAFGELEALFASGKPILLVTHVPFDSLVDEGLSERCRAAWNGLELLWAYDGFPFVVGEYGERLLDLIYAPDSPVVGVVSGHLHFAYHGPLTETLQQHVFDASHKGTLGYIVVGSRQ